MLISLKSLMLSGLFFCYKQSKPVLALCPTETSQTRFSLCLWYSGMYCNILHIFASCQCSSVHYVQLIFFPCYRHHALLHMTRDANITIPADPLIDSEGSCKCIITAQDLSLLSKCFAVTDTFLSLLILIKNNYNSSLIVITQTRDAESYLKIICSATTSLYAIWKYNCTRNSFLWKYSYKIYSS